MTPSPHRPYGAGDTPAPYPQQAPAPAPRRTGRIVAIVVAAVLTLCVGVPVVIAIAAGGDTEQPHTLTDQDAANRAAAAAASTSPAAAPATTAPSSPAATTTAPKPTKTTKPPVIIGEGIYRVGEDIPPGRYKVVERAAADCYWSRTRGTDIIDNSIAGGFPSFTARKGEDVEIGSSCPEFKRVGK